MSQKPKRIEFTEQELEQIKARKKRDELKNVAVSPEEVFVAEMGFYYGWDAVKSILNNEIGMEDANILLHGARKVWYRQIIDIASANFTVQAAAQSGKKAQSVMSKGLSDFIKQSKVEL